MQPVKTGVFLTLWAYRAALCVWFKPPYCTRSNLYHFHVGVATLLEKIVTVLTLACTVNSIFLHSPSKYFGEDLSIEKFKMYHPDFIRYLRNRWANYLQSRRTEWKHGSSLKSESTNTDLFMLCVFSCFRFLRSPSLKKFWNIYRPTTGAVMLLAALHTCSKVEFTSTAYFCQPAVYSLTSLYLPDTVRMFWLSCWPCKCTFLWRCVVIVLIMTRSNQFCGSAFRKHEVVLFLYLSNHWQVPTEPKHVMTLKTAFSPVWQEWKIRWK